MILILSLCLLVFINAMSIGLVFPLFAPLFTQQAAPLFHPGVALSTQTFFYSIILTVPTACMVVGAPFWGRISDRIGRRKVLIIGLAGVAFSFVLSALGIALGSLIVLFASRALAGFMDGTESVAQAAIADLSPPADKARNLGYATFAGTIGFIIGPILGGVLGEPSITGTFHYEIPFVLSCVLSLINAALIYRLFPQASSAPAPMTAAPSPRLLPLLVRGCAICLDKRIRLYSLLLLVLHFSLAAFFQISTLALVERFGYSPLKVGVFTTFVGACFSLGVLIVIQQLLARVRHTRLVKAGLILMIAGMAAAFYFRQSDLFAWVGVAPLMLGIAMMFNVLLSFVSNAVSESEQGDAMGSGTALKALGWLLSSAVISVWYPHMSTILLLIIGVLIVTLICASAIRKPPSLPTELASDAA